MLALSLLKCPCSRLKKSIHTVQNSLIQLDAAIGKLMIPIQHNPRKRSLEALPVSQPRKVGPVAKIENLEIKSNVAARRETKKAMVQIINTEIGL